MKVLEMNDQFEKKKSKKMKILLVVEELKMRLYGKVIWLEESMAKLAELKSNEI